MGVRRCRCLTTNKRLLDEIERSLTRDDRTFATGVPLADYPQRPLVIATGLLVAGLAGILTVLGVTEGSMPIDVLTSVAWLTAVVAAVVLRAPHHHRDR